MTKKPDHSLLYINTPTYMRGVLQVKSNRILQAVAHEALHCFEIKPTQWSILGQLYDRPKGKRASDIAGALGVEASLITMLAQALIERGLIDKTIHSRDGRAKLLKITSCGTQIVDQIEKILKERLEHLLAGATATDLGAYQHIQQTIIANYAGPKQTIAQ